MATEAPDFVPIEDIRAQFAATPQGDQQSLLDRLMDTKRVVYSLEDLADHLNDLQTIAAEFELKLSPEE